MLSSTDSTESGFLDGLRAKVGHRIRIWYDAEYLEGEPLRCTVEGRLASVDTEVTLTESRIIHPSMMDDHATRTAPLSWVRGYNELDPCTGLVTKTIARAKRPTDSV